jgi:hypothetical protein
VNHFDKRFAEEVNGIYEGRLESLRWVAINDIHARKPVIITQLMQPQYGVLS